MTCKYPNSYAYYNTYRGGEIRRYGEGQSNDYCWNIPICRFNGEDSPSVTQAQTILYWLKYDLQPKQFETNKEISSAFNALKKCQDYLVIDGDKFVLDRAKVNNAIHSNIELNWIPEKTAEILSAKKIVGSAELIDKFRNNLLHVDEHSIALDPYDEKILTDPNRGHWDLWDMDGKDGEENFLNRPTSGIINF